MLKSSNKISMEPKKKEKNVKTFFEVKKHSPIKKNNNS